MRTVQSKIAVILIKLIASLPLFILKGIGFLIYFINGTIIRYRNKIVSKNIAIAFPYFTIKEQRKIKHQFYRFLTDLIVETIHTFSIPAIDLKQRVKFTNTEVFIPYIQAKQPVILMMGHFGNWEMIGIAGGLYNIPFYSLYREQKNKAVNSFIKENRQRFGLQLIAEKSAIRKLPILLKQGEFKAITFIADQKVSPKRAFWIPFFKKPATFVKGPEMYAKKYNCPVFFVSVSIPKRGFYNVEFQLITDKPIEWKDGKLTRQFANMLEQQIENQPPYWLWSHNRWKHKPTDNNTNKK